MEAEWQAVHPLTSYNACSGSKIMKSRLLQNEFHIFLYPPWLIRHFKKLPGSLYPHFLSFNQPGDPGLPQILDGLCS